jgi:hypothetical protein
MVEAQRVSLHLVSKRQPSLSARRRHTIRFVGAGYRLILKYLKALTARIDLSHFPRSCCG